MRKLFCKSISLLLTAVLLFSCCLSAFAANSTEAKTLQFHDGKFKILILSDIQDTNTPQKETMALMNAAIDAAEPDFIVLLGGQYRRLVEGR